MVVMVVTGPGRRREVRPELDSRHMTDQGQEVWDPDTTGSQYPELAAGAG